jgi:hypothetical protein
MPTPSSGVRYKEQSEARRDIETDSHSLVLVHPSHRDVNSLQPRNYLILLSG